MKTNSSILLFLFHLSCLLFAGTSQFLRATRLDSLEPASPSASGPLRCRGARLSLSVHLSLDGDTNADLIGGLNRRVAEASTDLPPDEFEVVREIGRGGEGTVYLVKDKASDKLYVAKVGPLGRIRAERNNRMAAVGTSVNRQRIILVGQDEKNIWENPQTGSATILLEYIQGKTLEYMIENGELTEPDTIFQTFRWLSLNVSQYHRQVDKAHMDLKPANIIMVRGRPKLLDFGIAVELGAQQGKVVGTGAFMSPGHVLGEVTSEKDDLHAVLEMGRRALIQKSFFDLEKVKTNEGAAAGKIYKRNFPLSDVVMGVFLAVSPYTLMRQKSQTGFDYHVEKYRDLSILYSLKYESYEAFLEVQQFLKKQNPNSFECYARAGEVMSASNKFQNYVGKNVVAKMEAAEIAEMLITCHEFDPAALGLKEIDVGRLWTAVKKEIRAIKSKRGEYKATVSFHEDNPYFYHPDAKDRADLLLAN